MGTAFRFRIWFTLLWLAGIVAALIALSLSQAHAQSMACLEFDKLAKGLADKYHEVPAGSGITGQGSAALIVFASPAGATWTVAILDQKGQACVVATGQDWLDVIPPKEVVPGTETP